MTFGEVFNFFIALLVICNPVSGLSVLLSLTHGRSAEEKHKIAVNAGIAIIIILVIVTFTGPFLLSVLGIGLPAFQLAGGFVVFMVAFSMLQAEKSKIQQTREDQKDAIHKDSIAVVPLAIPVMAGPGSMSTIIVAVNSYPGIMNLVYISICSIFVGVVLTGFLYFAHRMEKILGQSGINLVNRIGGLILAAIAVDIMAKGAVGLFPGWIK